MKRIGYGTYVTGSLDRICTILRARLRYSLAACHSAERDADWIGGVRRFRWISSREIAAGVSPVEAHERVKYDEMTEGG